MKGKKGDSVTSEQPFGIYISHRKEDTIAAQGVKHALELYSAGAAHFYLSSESEPGTEWTEYIRELFAQTHLFILLVTERSDLSSSWDWSLFETGLFSSLAEEQQRPLVAIVAPSVTLPSVLGSLKVVRGVKNEIAYFLEELFGGTRLVGDRPPLNLSLVRDRDSLNELALRICDHLTTPAEPLSRSHGRSLILTFRAHNIDDGIIPSNAQIDCTSQTLSLFGLLPGRSWIWGELEDNLRGDKSWVRELGFTIQAIMEDRLPSPIASKFEGADGIVYLPIVLQDEQRSSGVRRFNIVFLPTEFRPADPTLVFVITSFRPEMEPSFEAVQEAAKRNDLRAERVEEEIGDYRITDRILEMIQRARLIVADLTFERPNVYFELGYARGIGKTVITTIKKGSLIHFDVKDWTYIEYDDSRNLERDLIQRFEVELSRNASSDK